MRDPTPSLQAVAAELRRIEQRVLAGEAADPADARAVARAAAKLAKSAARLQRDGKARRPKPRPA